MAVIQPVDGTRNLIFKGRPKGALGKVRRVLKHALMLAAEKSKHSKSGDLFGYCLFLADEKPELFVSLLGRLIPQQRKEEVHEFHYSDINPNAPISEMVSAFTTRINAVTIDHMNPDNEDEDG